MLLYILKQKQKMTKAINPRKVSIPIRRVTEEESLKEFENRKRIEAIRKKRKKETLVSLLGFLLPISVLLFLLIGMIGNGETNAYIEKKAPKTMTGTFKAVETKISGQAVSVHGPQLEEMKARGYNNTRILDLLMAKSMECHQYDGNCIGFLRDKNWRIIEPRVIIDYGPFQINNIHTEQFNKSLEFKTKGDWAGLFNYQLTYANGLIESYMNNYCAEEHYKALGRTFTNERRAKCVYVSYNGSKNKHYYAKIAWEKRKIISTFLFSKGYLILN